MYSIPKLRNTFPLKLEHRKGIVDPDLWILAGNHGVHANSSQHLLVPRSLIATNLSPVEFLRTSTMCMGLYKCSRSYCTSGHASANNLHAC